MMQTWPRFRPIFGVLLGLSFLAACKPSDFDLKTVNPGEKPVAITTTNFITDLVKTIGGNEVEVIGLMGAGVDPHLYKASAGDVRKLSRSNIVFYGGLHLEGKMVELFEKMPKTVAVTDAIPEPLRIRPPGGFQGQFAYDPHIWFDLEAWSFTAEAVRDGLSKVDPTHSGLYAQRVAAYRLELKKTDDWVKQQINTIPANQRVMITAHDAFIYFGKRYGLEVRGLQGVSTVAETGTKDVQDLAIFLTERKIPAIFVESSVPARSIEAVVQAVRAKGGTLRIGGELFSDAAGEEGTIDGTYIGMVRHNVGVIVSGLRGETQ